VSETLVDARGLRCPWPVLRLARAMREAGDGAVIRIVADDPAAPREIVALAAERGWQVSQEDDAVPAAFRLEKSNVNQPFTLKQ
jgi:tRNA 2-thiouridine synthesizing protein A